jgi:hypothetical protein
MAIQDRVHRPRMDAQTTSREVYKKIISHVGSMTKEKSNALADSAYKAWKEAVSEEATLPAKGDIFKEFVFKDRNKYKAKQKWNVGFATGKMLKDLKDMRAGRIKTTVRKDSVYINMSLNNEVLGYLGMETRGSLKGKNKKLKRANRGSKSKAIEALMRWITTKGISKPKTTTKQLAFSIYNSWNYLGKKKSLDKGMFSLKQNKKLRASFLKKFGNSAKSTLAYIDKKNISK